MSSRTQNSCKLHCDLLACPVFENQDRLPERAEPCHPGRCRLRLESGEFKPELSSYLPDSPSRETESQKALLLVGAGQEKGIQPGPAPRNRRHRSTRRAPGTLPNRRIFVARRVSLSPNPRGRAPKGSCTGITNPNLQDPGQRNAGQSTVVSCSRRPRHGGKRLERGSGAARSSARRQFCAHPGNEPANMMTPCPVRRTSACRGGPDRARGSDPGTRRDGETGHECVARRRARQCAAPKLIILRIPGQKRRQERTPFCPGRQRRHLRQRRDLDQAGRQNGGYEGRHGRRRGGAGRHVGDRRTWAAPCASSA